MTATAPTHSHPHDGHDHDHLPEAGQQPEGGPVMLDIGDDVGALIAFMDTVLVGTEIHVRRPEATTTIHTGVWERDLGTQRVVVAVFPSLPEGAYDVLGPDGEPTRSVTIRGGAVLEIDLRG